MAWGRKRGIDDLIAGVSARSASELYIMPFRSVDEDSVGRLAEAVSASDSLRILSTGRHSISVEGLKQLGSAASASSALRDLRVGSQSMGDEGTSALVAGLLSGGGATASSSVLDSFDLSNKSFGVGGCTAIGALVSSSACPLSLDLSHNASLAAKEAIAALLSRPPAVDGIDAKLATPATSPLRSLSLKQCPGLGAEHLLALAQALEPRPEAPGRTFLGHIQAIDLSGCNLSEASGPLDVPGAPRGGSSGAAEAADGAAKSVSKAGPAARLLGAMGGCASLRSVVLRGCGLSTAGLDALVTQRMLKRAPASGAAAGSTESTGGPETNPVAPIHRLDVGANPDLGPASLLLLARAVRSGAVGQGSAPDASSPAVGVVAGACSLVLDGTGVGAAHAAVAALAGALDEAAGSLHGSAALGLLDMGGCGLAGQEIDLGPEGGERAGHSGLADAAVAEAKAVEMEAAVGVGDGRTAASGAGADAVVSDETGAWTAALRRLVLSAVMGGCEELRLCGNAGLGRVSVAGVTEGLLAAKGRGVESGFAAEKGVAGSSDGEELEAGAGKPWTLKVLDLGFCGLDSDGVMGTVRAVMEQVRVGGGPMPPMGRHGRTAGAAASGGGEQADAASEHGSRGLARLVLSGNPGNSKDLEAAVKAMPTTAAEASVLLTATGVPAAGQWLPCEVLLGKGTASNRPEET